MKINKDNYGMLAIILLLAIALILSGLRTCEPKPIIHTPIDLKPELKKQDSFRTVIRYHDSARLTVLKKWKTITNIKDSVKCYEEIKYVIQACDTVLKADSTLIVALYGQHSNDSVIQFKQGVTIAMQSDSIRYYKKQVRKQKIQKIALIGAWILREGIGVGQKIKP